MRTPLLIATLVWAVACGGSDAANSGSPSGAGAPAVASAGVAGSLLAAAGNAAGGAVSAGGSADTAAGASAGGQVNVAGNGGAASLAGAGSGGAASGVAGASSAGSGGTAAVAGSAGVAGSGGSAGGEPVQWPCPQGAPCVIMPLGDSITYGYGSTTGGGYRVPLLTQALADRHSITFVGSVSSGPATVSGQPFPKGNEGHSGYSIDDSSSTKGISPLVDHALATYKPNIVLLMIGTNDMHYTLDLPNAPTRLGKLLDQITTDSPNALVVVAKIVPANGAQDTPTQAYNAAIPAVVQARTAQGKHLVLVDMYAALGHWSTTLFKDSEHPNDAGYSLMANTWYSAIHSLLP
jgi:lysophospholipase L1-like esterase